MPGRATRKRVISSLTCPRVEVRWWREPEDAVPNTLALGYAALGYGSGIAPMAANGWPLAVMGVLLTAHSMIVAAYLVHEAAHYTLFARPAHNRIAGEAMNWIAGSAYASFERIRHLHLRHHRDRADVACFDYKSFLKRHPIVRRTICALEWVHVPAVEDYGAVTEGAGRADSYVGAHGVSFLTVI